MRRALIIVIVVLIGIGGYLRWDWHDKTKKLQLEPSITLYYWTDARGQNHISDSAPPENIQNVTTEKGYKYVRAPLVIIIRDKAIDFYQYIKKKLSKPRKTKKK